MNVPYEREAALQYAKAWAFSRNPAYLDFETLGGDCTNFASQCLYAGSGVMNWTPVYGWYYATSSNRTASWTGVEYLYRFLTQNKAAGPYAEEVSQAQVQPGDLVQLGTADGHFYHCPVIVEANGTRILVAAHSFDAWRRPLNSYVYDRARFLHILGVRN